VSNFFTPEFNNESAIAPWNASLEPTKAIIPQLDANRVLTGGVGQEVKIPTLTPEAYDNIILPDDLLTPRASAVSTDSNSSLPDSSVDLLTGQAILPDPGLRKLVHMEGIGDSIFPEGAVAGTTGQSRRLEGFQINLDFPIPGLSMEYMAHLQGIGDTSWVTEAQYLGTRGQSRRLEGFAIRLTGSQASNYDVFYQAHLEGIGNTPIVGNGQFSGTRGQSRRVEAISVWVQPTLR